MPKIFPSRMMAEIEGDFVVFLIGMRINRWWKIHKWWSVAMAMPRMVRELAAHPELGCLHAELRLGLSIQYWRSFNHLEAYARDASHEHLPAWQAFNSRVQTGSGDVGIWHETFLIRAGEYETLYGAMPRVGLASAGRHLPISGSHDSARQRLAKQPAG
jgi:Monooxygenase af470-like